MNISIIGFVVCAVVALAFLAAMAIMEIGGQPMGRNQTGDTTLGRNSINWAGGIALAVAVVVCFFLM